MVTAYFRPVFDFTGSLHLARTFEDFAAQLERSRHAMAPARDAALAVDAFDGPWGDEFRTRAEEQDENIRVTAAKLRHDSASTAAGSASRIASA